MKNTHFIAQIEKEGVIIGWKADFDGTRIREVRSSFSGFGTFFETMFVIIVYDMNVERVAKICQYLRRYLDWVQNSVFEGELTDSQFKRIKYDLKEMVHEDVDSVRIYSFRTKEQVKVETMGVLKADTGCIIWVYDGDWAKGKRQKANKLYPGTKRSVFYGVGDLYILCRLLYIPDGKLWKELWKANKMHKKGNFPGC